MSLDFLAVLAPAVFILTAIVSWFQPGLRPRLVKKMGMVSTLLSMLIAAISCFFVAKHGLIETPFIGIYGLGLSLRLDVVSVSMLAMIAILGFIVVRFSLNYMDGDDRQGRFIGRLAATIASVELLVLAGNLGLLLVAWILTSISLHRLLVFYKDRPGAIIAARKKHILARLGDACLLGAVILLYMQFGTGNLEVIFQELRTSIATGVIPSSIETGALLLAFAALLKSAQFPTHGWLIEVMETPTPVSALLHAGLLNAGPFLIIRMAFVMEASSYVPMFLMIIGGFTALFASVAYLTQTSIKTALGYSSIAHMGFSLMVCGMGVYPAAMLHLVAHSFYKAHAFLSSGSVIDIIRASKIKSIKRKGVPVRIALGILLAMAVYAGFVYAWGIDPVEEFALLVIGGIIVMGMSRLFTSAVDSNGSLGLVLRATLLSALVATAFFTLETGAHHLLSSQIPGLRAFDSFEVLAVATILFTFGTAVLVQIIAPTLSSRPFYRAMAVHLKNGFYANAVFDRMVGAFKVHTPKTNDR